MRDGEFFRQLDAQLRYYLRIDHPENLSDEEWAMRVRELEWVRTHEAKVTER